MTGVLDAFAVTTPGLESLLRDELTSAGLDVRTSEPGGVGFGASPDDLVRALLWSRTANRVTVRIAHFRARSFAELERHAAKVEWSRVLDGDVPVHFRVTSKKSRLYHQDGIAERLERAALAGVNGVPAIRAPSAAEALEADVTRVPAVQRVIVRVARDEFTLSADASGALLHLRGYRQAVGKAPLRETLAAALLIASGWTPDVPLVDPMCGSGTIPIEAALIARRMAPGRARCFAAERWPGFTDAFAGARALARAGEMPGTGLSIVGQDRDAGAIMAARANAERAGVVGDVEWLHAALSHLGRDDAPGWVITNPPYGARVGERARLRDLYASLGHVVRDRRPRARLAMLGADRMLDGHVGLEWQELFRTTNGGIPIRGLLSASPRPASSRADP